MKEFYKVIVNEKEYEVTVEENTENVFDYEAYEKSLTNILEQAQKEFWTHCVDFNRHQIVVGKNNLWVAAALIAAYAATYNKFYNAVDLTSIIGLIFCTSFVLSVSAFGLCLYGMPSRKGYIFPYDNGWAELSFQAYERLESNVNNSNIAYITAAIEKTDEANKSNRATNSERAKIFRITSWLLVSSFCLSLISGLIFLFDVSRKQDCQSFSVNTKNYIRCIMSNEKTAQKTTAKPDVPVPNKPKETTSTTTRMVLDSADPVVPQGGKILTEKAK